MKRILTYLSAAALALGMAAQSTFSGSTLYGYCTNASMPVTISAGNELGAAFQLNVATIKKFTGCKITAIAIANGNSLDPAVTSLPINIFVGETFNTDPMQAFSATMDLSAPLKYKEYALTEPIEITADMSQLFFGFSAICEPTKYNPLVTDANADESAGPGDYIGMKAPGATEWVWEQQRQAVGMPCIRLKIEGDALAANSVSIIESHLPTYAAPGATATGGIYVRNLAYNTVESLTMSYTVNGGDPQSLRLNLTAPLLFNEHSSALTFSLPIPESEGNDLPLDIKITAINADNAANQAPATQCSASTTYLSLARGYEKAVVVEEATATWCGFCPRGLVGMKAMAEAHANDGRFIPIATHYNDRLTVQSYDQFFGEDYTAATTPSCMINRNKETYGSQDPSLSFLQAAYAQESQIPALCRLAIESMTFDASKKTLTVNANAEFALSLSGDYGFAYVLTEDNVGPFDQTNYFSPEAGRGLKLDWWDEQPNPVPDTYYDHVARFIYPFRGLKGSVPSDVEASATYSHSASLQTNAVSDINRCNVIVMMVNRTSKRIENAVMAPYADFASIKEVNTPADPSANAPVYDLQGRRVANPTRGLYITNGRKILL